MREKLFICFSCVLIMLQYTCFDIIEHMATTPRGNELYSLLKNSRIPYICVCVMDDISCVHITA